MEAIRTSYGLLTDKDLSAVDNGAVLFAPGNWTPEEQAALLFADPVEVLRVDKLDEVNRFFVEIEKAQAQGYHLAGYLAYELGYAFEDVGPLPDSPLPLAWFGVYRKPDVIVRSEDNLSDAALDRSRAPDPLRLKNLRFDLTPEAYRLRIETIREHIREGDVYQINYTGKFRFRFEGDPQYLFRKLLEHQSVPYGAFLHFDDVSILSLSPELFFRLEGDRVTARPMKGTVRRGRTVEEDATLRDWLANDPKSRAENLMIVDLLRNDLSIVSKPGSVQVPALFTTERYETLNQMTSSVEGVLRPGVTVSDVIRALFPCGSVTGAPKIRAMQIIRRLEGEARGPYTGAIGYISPEGRAVFNVAIRTVALREGEGELAVGSGIVWDSDADHEYQECKLKAAFLTAEYPHFDLIETMRWENGAIELLELHLDRLEQSAYYFDFRFDRENARHAIIDHVSSLGNEGLWKVRLLLSRVGQVALSHSRIEQASDGLITLSGVSVDSSDRFLFHKTTRRALFDQEYENARRSGFAEVIFVNERQEVTEGSRNNIFVRIQNAYATPPIACGLLPGVKRKQLLHLLDATERVLTLADLESADEILISNAVQGVRKVQLYDADDSKQSCLEGGSGQVPHGA